MKQILALAVLLMAFGTSAAVAEPRPQVAYAQPQGWHGVLSVDDQGNFDKDYAKWIEATRKNDQDDISDNARKMQEIMARYNIPVSVSFDQVASNGAPAAYPGPAYPNGAYAAYGAQRLSPDDQKQFDKYYSKWVEATRKNDQEDVSENAGKMQEIMARYRIAPGVPFAQVASGGTNGAYANGTYAYPAAQSQRLNAHDQHEFDEAYNKWLKARHKKDRDDIDKNEHKMQDIMARYNIPANVPFDQIASPRSSYR